MSGAAIDRGTWFFAALCLALAACGGGGAGAPLPEGPTTLAYAVSECRQEKGGATSLTRQVLYVRQGDGARRCPIARAVLTRAMRSPKCMQQGTWDVVIARAGEETVCPTGTLCSRMVRDGTDWISEGDFMAVGNVALSDDRLFVCACCGRVVAARDDRGWRVHLRRGWVQ